MAISKHLTQEPLNFIKHNIFKIKNYDSDFYAQGDHGLLFIMLNMNPSNFILFFSITNNMNKTLYSLNETCTGCISVSFKLHTIHQGAFTYSPTERILRNYSHIIRNTENWNQECSFARLLFH